MEELLAPLVPGLAAAVGIVGAAIRVLGLLRCNRVVAVEGLLERLAGDVLGRDRYI